MEHILNRVRVERKRYPDLWLRFKDIERRLHCKLTYTAPEMVNYIGFQTLAESLGNVDEYLNHTLRQDIAEIIRGHPFHGSVQV